MFPFTFLCVLWKVTSQILFRISCLLKHIFSDFFVTLPGNESILQFLSCLIGVCLPLPFISGFACWTAIYLPCLFLVNGNNAELCGIWFCKNTWPSQGPCLTFQTFCRGFFNESLKPVKSPLEIHLLDLAIFLSLRALLISWPGCPKAPLYSYCHKFLSFDEKP